MNILKNFKLGNLNRLFGMGRRSCREIKNVSVEDAYNLIQNGNAFILDVRTYQEYNRMHIKDAVNIPLVNLMYMNNLLPKEKNTNILVYCLSGSRARNASMILEDMGYTNVYMWPGGSINQMLNKDIIQK